jgi:hypothetical protein
MHLLVTVGYYDLSSHTSQIAWPPYYQLLPMQMKLCGIYKIKHFENGTPDKTSSTALEVKYSGSGIL